MTGDVRVCMNDGEPLVFTFEFPGAEYYCVMCEGKEGMFGKRAELTPELEQKYLKNSRQYDEERAVRLGRSMPEAPKVGDQGVMAPVCCSCSATPAVGTPLPNGKPALWYSRTVDGVTTYACRSACIPKGEPVLPW